MITRLVKMEFHPADEAAFMAKFETIKHAIRAQPGCHGLELLRQQNGDQLSIWTRSLWDAESDLDLYRHSSLFAETWAFVKPLFTAKAQAWTLTSEDHLP